MRGLFSLDGPVMRAMSDLTTLILLNLVTVVFCIPVITAGASLTAMHTILMRMFEQQEGHVISGFFAAFKANLKSATPPWLAFLAAALVLYLDYSVFSGHGANRTLMIPVYLGALILAVVFVWLFPVMAKFETGFAGTFRNTFGFAVGYLPRTLLMVAVNAVVPFVLTQSMRLWPLAVLLGLSLPAYFSMLIYHGAVKREVERLLGKTDAGGGSPRGEAAAEDEAEDEAGAHGLEHGGGRDGK